MSAYGTARTLAERLGMNDAVELLQQTEDEEQEADATLTKVATSLYESSGEEEESEEADSEKETVSAGASRFARGPSAKRGNNRKVARAAH